MNKNDIYVSPRFKNEIKYLGGGHRSVQCTIWDGCNLSIKFLDKLFIFSGLCASIFVFIAFGVTQAKDGPFLRPHPGKQSICICKKYISPSFDK